MSKFAIAIAAMLLALPVASTAQDQADRPNTPTSQHGKKNTGTETQGTVFRLEVRRVPVDVVVTDKQGNPVRGLTKKDFVVKEDKHVQRILSFDYADGSVASYVPPKLPLLPANTFVNEPTGPERGPLYVLYYDMVNTSMVDQMSAHQQLLDFIDHAPAGARFALFVNAAGLHLVQGFTSDRELLHAALLKTKGSGPRVPNVFIYAELYGRADGGAALSNLNFIAEYLEGIPGRKNLLWLASQFPIPTGPTETSTAHGVPTAGVSAFGGTETIDLTDLLKDAMKQTYSSMMRSQIALYPVALNGIVTDEDPGDMIADYQHMDDIAGATGGRAYYANNRVNELLDQAVDNGENYYTLSYAPTNTKYDGSERQINVTVANAKKLGYTLSYRQYYYAVSDDNVQTMHKHQPLQARFIAAKSEDTLYANIEHGAPMLHGVLFSAHLTAEGGPVMATAEQMTQLEDSPVYFRTRRRDKPVKTPAPVMLQKYRIGYGVFDAQLKSLAHEKDRPAVLEFAAAAYDADGRLLNSILNEGEVPAAAEKNKNPEALFHAEQELEVPPGAAWIRLAVRDMLNDRTGTMEVRLPLKADVMTAEAGKGN